MPRPKDLTKDSKNQVSISMKSIAFRPLRRVKKSGKIVVASYMQWRKVKTADYSKFELIMNDEYKGMPDGEYVHDHNGENLFWRHYNPEDIPMLNEYALEDGERPPYPPMWRTKWGMYSAKGLDCDGVPAFSHYTSNGIVIMDCGLVDFEPLTVATVRWWLGWFLFNLKNYQLQIGTP
jgi:hypothetical protein